MTNARRSLNVEDLYTAAEILDSVLDNLDAAEVQNLLSGKAEGSPQEIGFRLIRVAVKHAREPFFRFLASVNGLTVEEFKAKPAEEVPNTISDLVADPRNKAFFLQLRAMLPGA